MTEKMDNARAAGFDRSRTGQNEAAGPRRDEFHIIIIIDQGITNLEGWEASYSDRLVTGADQSIISRLLHAVSM